MRPFFFKNTKREPVRSIKFILNALISLILMTVCTLGSETIKTISVTKSESATTVEISLTKAINFTAETFLSPYRIEIELPSELAVLPKQMKGQSWFKNIRLEKNAKKKSLLVLETHEPVLIRSASYASDEPKIILQLVATDTETFATFLSLKAEQKTQMADPLPPVAKPTEVDVNTKSVAYDAKKIIVIDAGHGGIDPGAIGKGGTKEKEVVLAFAKVLKSALENYPNFEVKLSRSEDKYLPLSARVKFTRDEHADLLISVHADTLRGKTARGATFYTLSDKASDEEAEALAHKENKVDEIAGFKLPVENPEIAGILIDLVRRESKNHANYFARKAASEVEKVTKMSGAPVRSAGFAVLTATDVPSVLIELGFLSSSEDEKLLTDPKWRNKVAKAIASSVDEYLSGEIAVNSISRAAAAPPN